MAFDSLMFLVILNRDTFYVIIERGTVKGEDGLAFFMSLTREIRWDFID